MTKTGVGMELRHWTVETKAAGADDDLPAPLIRVYRVRDSEPFFFICVAPRIFGRCIPLVWSEKAAIIADYFCCDANDVASYEDDNGAELITICGKIVGSFDRAIEASS